MLVVNPLTVNNCGSGLRLYDSPYIKLTIWLVWAGLLSVSWPIGVQLAIFSSGVSVVLLTPKGSPGVPTRCNCRVLPAVPRRLCCFGSLVILDVARCYLWLFTLYINIKLGKNSC